MTMKRDQIEIGGRSFDVLLGVFLIVVLAMVWNTSKARAEPAKGSEAAGTTMPEPTFGAPGVSAVLPLQGTICLVDDSNQNQIQFDSTGSYTFTNCAGFSLSGQGVFTTRGLLTTLRDVKSDRRLELNIDNSAKKASAGLQIFAPQPKVFTINDRNITNDVCGCAPPP